MAVGEEGGEDNVGRSVRVDVESTAGRALSHSSCVWQKDI